MNIERIKEIQKATAYPDSVSVQQALLKVWNECEQEQLRIGAVSGSLPKIKITYEEFTQCIADNLDEFKKMIGNDR